MHHASKQSFKLNKEPMPPKWYEKDRTILVAFLFSYFTVELKKKQLSMLLIIIQIEIIIVLIFFFWKIIPFFFRSSFDTAITIGVRILGPAAGFILGSFCTRYYVDLSNPGFGPNDPKWVGAWYLGKYSYKFLFLSYQRLHIKQP